MSLRFPYQHFPVHHPRPSLGGQTQRPRPVIVVSLLGPQGIFCERALLDTGADDTVFPESVAAKIGVDLTTAPTGSGGGVGLLGFTIRYAEVAFRVTDGQEQREWKAWVGFTSAPLRRPLLGYAGFLNFFDATFFGQRQEVELTVNSAYSGT
jgi:hypothetical protein